MGSASRARLYRTEAIILRRRDFGEADRILTLYAPGSGKTRVLAKGVRKPKSRKSGHVELLTHSNLLIAKGRNLDIVTQAEMIHSFLPIRRDLLRTSYAYYAAELLDRFTEEGEENRPLFDLFLSALFWLSDADDLDLALRCFELRLLGYVGYRPQLFSCLGCERPVEGESSLFSPRYGGLLCSRCGENERGCREVSWRALATLRYLQTREYAACRRLTVDRPTHEELEVLMRRYITYLLERRLKSVDFMDALRREEAASAVSALKAT